MKVLRYAGAGFLATIPMSLVMAAMHYRTRQRRHSKLPPEEVTENILQKAEVKSLDRPEKKVTSLIAHFGFGAAAAVPYLVFSRIIPLPPILRGAAYGGLVWAVNYAGILPAAKIQPQLENQPKGRNGAMIAAHLIWGAFLDARRERKNS